MLLDIQGDMEAIKNTKKQMEKLLNNDEDYNYFIDDKKIENAEKIKEIFKEKNK